MAYKKVYYEQLGTACSQIDNRSSKWQEQLDSIQKQLALFVKAKTLKGSGAESIYNYLQEIHGVAIGMFQLLLETNIAVVDQYFYGYKNNVDSGGDPDIYTTLVYGELFGNGTVNRRFIGYMDRADSIASSANRYANSVSDLVSLPRINANNIVNSLKTAAKYATDVDKKITAHENKNASSLNDPRVLLEQINRIINTQLSDGRYPVTKYPSGGIATMIDPEKLSASIERCAQTVDDFQKSECYEDARNLTVSYEQYVEDIHLQEEKESRQWVKWVAVGATVVLGAVVTAVTAGAAGPVVVVAVGAVCGATSAAVNSFADNYVENGSFTEGMDWNKFSKDVVIGGVTGAVSAYFGSANSVGSAIKQPIKGALRSATQSVIKNGVEIGVSVGWDVGEALVNKRSVSWSNVWDNNKSLVKKGFVDTVTSFAGGFVDTKFSISDATTVKKTAKKTFLEGTAKNLNKAGAGLVANTAWDVGEGCLITKDKEKMWENIKQDALNTGKSFLKDELKTAGESVKTGINNKKQEKVETASKEKTESNAPKSVLSESKPKTNSTVKEIGKAGGNFLKTAGGKVAGTVAGTVKEHITGEREGPLTLDEIAKDVHDNRFDIVKDSANKAVNDAVKDHIKNDPDYLKNQIKKQQSINPNKVDQVETVSFENYDTKSFTKTDYEAAVKVAGKGAYKDMSVADVLGIHDSKVDTSKPIYETVDVDNISNAPGVNRSNAKAIKNPNYGKK